MLNNKNMPMAFAIGIFLFANGEDISAITTK
jgi:hypothetical protein